MRKINAKSSIYNLLFAGDFPHQDDLKLSSIKIVIRIRHQKHEPTNYDLIKAINT